jgi:hypothetical protein
MTEKGIMAQEHLLPRAVRFDRFDKQIIVCLIVIFLVLFVWLLGKNVQPPTYAFWTFTALLTLIFVGFLRATGIFRTAWGALGGSAAVYAGLLLLTAKTFDHYNALGQQNKDLVQENKNLRDQVTALNNTLKQIDPAKYELQQHFIFLQQKNFKAAYDDISDARKAETRRNLPPGVDEYAAYAAAFDNTEAYKNLTFELVREESESERIYRVTNDVMDHVPHNELFESGAKVIASFNGSVDKDGIIGIAVDNLKEYYVVPESAIPAIQEYIRTRTIVDILDPTFVGEMVIALRNLKDIELQQLQTHPSYVNIWRYLRYDNVVMIKQNDGKWRIRSGLSNPVVALYKWQ